MMVVGVDGMVRIEKERNREYDVVDVVDGEFVMMAHGSGVVELRGVLVGV